MAPYNEKVQFRLFQMPCCSTQICWINPRFPTYCPECGEGVLLKLRSEAQHTLAMSEAWIRYTIDTPAEIEARKKHDEELTERIRKNQMKELRKQ